MIKILDYTTKEPLTMIGTLAGICYDSSNSDKEKVIQRALDCIKQKHERVLEFPDVYVEISEFSAKVIRELYTHIGGSPTRLQESTRYVDCENFKESVPITIRGPEQTAVWNKTISAIHSGIKELKKLGVPKEDYSNLLPLAYQTKMIWKVNLRCLVNFFNQRLCRKAYFEIRFLADRLKNELKNYSYEWKLISELLFKPKCSVYGKCLEKNPCGYLYSKKDK